MKFARQFQESLNNDGYPPEWIDSAISYAPLKKCIKRIQRELATLGLDVETLRQLLASAEDEAAGAQDSPVALVSKTDNESQDDAADERRRSSASSGCSDLSDPGKDELNKQPFQYTFSNADATPSRHIIPKLLFVVDGETGEPLSAGLAPETRNYLHQLAITEKLTNIRITSTADDDTSPVDSHLETESNQRHLRYIQVPLTTDSEFFGVLEKELTGLAALQKAERKQLADEIHEVSSALSRATNPESKARRKDLARWRQLFECYIDAQVFFATNEQDHGTRESGAAAKNFATFLDNARTARLLSGYKTKESAKALELFLSINKELLQSLRFQEINHIAMRKILKKFDKRTALGASSTFSSSLPQSVISADFSRALAAQVSTEIVSIIPQLDDYLCPICFTIAYRPIRLRCGHIFCLRCMVLLQRDHKDNCALCRQPVVMEANSGNLEESLINFLERYFPDEVKEKQKAVGQAISREQFGEDLSCCVM